MNRTWSWIVTFGAPADELDDDRPVDYGNLHLLKSSYLPPRSQSSIDDPQSDQSATQATSIDQSSSSAPVNGQSQAIDSQEEANQDAQLVYSSLLLHESDVEDEDPKSDDRDCSTVVDEQCRLMEVTVWISIVEWCVSKHVCEFIYLVSASPNEGFVARWRGIRCSCHWKQLLHAHPGRLSNVLSYFNLTATWVPLKNGRLFMKRAVLVTLCLCLSRREVR